MRSISNLPLYDKLDKMFGAAAISLKRSQHQKHKSKHENMEEQTHKKVFRGIKRQSHVTAEWWLWYGTG